MNISGFIDAEVGGALIEACGGPNFGSVLLSEAQKYAHVEEVFAFNAPKCGPAKKMASCSTLTNCENRAERYIQRYQIHDPAYRARFLTPVGNGFAVSVVPEQITAYDYRAYCFENPKLAEKLCFGWRGKESTSVINFYRKGVDSRFSVYKLQQLANIGLSAMARYNKSRFIKESDFIQLMLPRIASEYPEFSEREREVCAYSLAGFSAKGIGIELGIATSSVLTYRQRAYRRANISSFMSLLPSLIS